MTRTLVGIVAGLIALFSASPVLAADSMWPLRDSNQAAASQYDAPSGDEGESTDEGDDGGVADEGASGGGAGGDAGTGSGTGSARAAAVGAGRAAAAIDSSITILSMGTLSDELRTDIDGAAAQGGLTISGRGSLSEERLKDVLESPLAERLIGGGGDPETMGQAVARLLIVPGADTGAVLEALFGITDPAPGPSTPLVFTRDEQLKGDMASFQRGLITGIDDADASSVYVERSDADKSFVPTFKRAGISTVDNLDEASGKAAFVAVLTQGAEGHFGTKPTADAVITDGVVQAKPSSFVTEGDSDGVLGSTTSYVLMLALLMGSGAWLAVGMRSTRHRRRRSH